MPTIEQQLFQENLELNRLEYQAEKIHLWSHEQGQRYIDELEARLRSPLVRAAAKLTRGLANLANG